MLSEFSARTRAVVALATVALVAGGSAALAESAHTSSGTLSACVKRTSGTLYMVKHCDKGDRKVTWSISGPKGATGAAGTPGTAGAPGTTATTATNANALGGLPSASYQRAVTGTCANGSAISSIGATGTATCSNTQNYAARDTIAQSSNGFSQTILKIPGLIEVLAETCTSSSANFEIVNLSPSTVGAFDIYGANADYGVNDIIDDVSSAGTLLVQFGEGTGAGAVTGTLRVSSSVGTPCVFQANAQVVTATS